MDDVSQRQTLTGVVTKVDPNATVPNGAGNDIANNNDTIASITATTTFSPDTTTVDTTTAIQSADNSLASRLGAENNTDGSPETDTTTIQTPVNPGTNGGETTRVPISESPGTTVPVNTIIPLSDTNVPGTTEPFTTTEIATSTSVADVTLTALSSTEPVDTSTNVASLPITERLNMNVPMLASQNLQTANDTTLPSSITVTPEATTMPTMNDKSESIENTVQPEKTTMITTDAVEDIETNTVQQSDATVPSQTTEITSTIEPTTTEEISNDIIEVRGTVTPVFTSTYRTRLINYAQNILSSLSEEGFSTVRTPVQRPTATTTVFPELSNAIPDSSPTNTESPTQPEETTTVREVGLGNVESTVPPDVELIPINGPEVTTRNTTGLDAAPQSNGQETNARNTLDSSTTRQILLNVVDNELNVTSDPEPTTTMTTQSTRALPTDEEVTITTTPTPISRLVDSVMENDSRSSNDTLLTELMTIAKTLFTEVMNDTRPDGTVGNDNKNRSVSISTGTLEATTTPSEFSKPLENVTEFIDVTTSVVDLSENEREDNSTRGPIVDSKISLVESNTRPADIDVGDVTTMSLSQIKTETPNTIMVTASMSSNKELTTNTPDSQLSNPIESSNNNTEQQTSPTVSNTEVQLSNRLSEFAMNLTTNNPLTSSVTANTQGMSPDVNEYTTSDIETITELTTSVAMTEINVVQTNVVDITNPIPTTTTCDCTVVPASDLQLTNNQSLVANASAVATTLPTVSDTSDTQSFDTEPPITESVHNLINSTDITTNRLNDITTNAPLTDLVSEMPNLIARLQDTMATTTAQGTAGSRIIQPEQTTETIITTTITIPTITASSTAPTTNSNTSPAPSTDATTIPSSSVEPTVATMTTMTTTISTTTFPTTSKESELTTTVGPMSEMTATTIDINENLVSTETTTDTSTTRGTTVASTEVDDLNATSNNGEAVTTTTTTTTSATPSTNMSTTIPTTTTSTTARITVLNRVLPSPAFTPFDVSNTGTPYLGRFGGNQITPDQKLNPTKAPIRDYLIYGIYPNKTIVRKRPEDNLIDGRNVNSPYVIFGIYPDGRLVRKFPNGTIIPDSPRNPVEVVFTLRTSTTTNRPAPRPYYYNQANQAGIYNNQYQAPVYYNNGRPLDELTGGAQSPGPLDFGLIGNAIGVTPGGPNFAGPLGPPASVSNANKMVSLSHLFIKIIFYTRNEFDQELNRG